MNAPLRLALALALTLASGCALERAPVIPLDGSSLDASVDATCTGSAETCNGVDDDCDGRTDEDFDRDTDLENCGVCGRACVSGDRGTPACRAGACAVDCDPGFADCDGDLTNGCEASLSAASTCGRCDRDCTTGAAPLCLEAAGAFSCVASCDAPSEVCGGSCVDVTASLAHCGGCDLPCPARTNSVASCSDSACEYACADGFADCNGDPSDGCERSLRTLTDCGSCGTPCALAHATASCGTGVCTFTSCDAGFGDCDANPSTGCELPVDTAANCGMCGRACAFSGAGAACVAGLCTLGACDPGLADCDGLVTNGCEARLDSVATCGSCTTSCSGTDRCAAGTCRGPNAVVEVEAGLAFTCARLADGRIYCWGADAVGQLGNGAGGASGTPGPVMGITTAIDLSVGEVHACAVLSDGTVRCWGDNGRRQLGDGTTTNSHVPVAAAGITDARAVAAGGEHTCVLRATGRVACWGRDNAGQLGDGTIGGDRSTAVDVVTGARVIAVAAGSLHTCAVLGSGEVRCWGENGGRQLGDGTTTDSGTPVRAGTIGDATGLTAGDDFTCALRTSGGGTLECWGANDHGQLGDGTTTGRGTLAAVQTNDGRTLSGVLSASAATDHTCARTATAVWCWGLNASGRLGDGSTTERLVAFQVGGAALNTLDVAAGGEHSCAALSAGGVSCWGENGSGQLGDGTTTDHSNPTPVTGLP